MKLIKWIQKKLDEWEYKNQAKRLKKKQDNRMFGRPDDVEKYYKEQLKK